MKCAFFTSRWQSNITSYSLHYANHSSALQGHRPDSLPITLSDAFSPCDLLDSLTWSSVFIHPVKLPLNTVNLRLSFAPWFWVMISFNVLPMFCLEFWYPRSVSALFKWRVYKCQTLLDSIVSHMRGSFNCPCMLDQQGNSLLVFVCLHTHYFVMQRMKIGHYGILLGDIILVSFLIWCLYGVCVCVIFLPFFKNGRNIYIIYDILFLFLFLEKRSRLA